MLSTVVFGQSKFKSKIISCTWKVDEIESFIIEIGLKPFTNKLGTYVEDRMVGPGGKYIESYNAKPSLSLNPAFCILKVENSQFSIPSHRLNFEWQLNQNNFLVTEKSGFGPSIEQQSFSCSDIDQFIVSKLQDICATRGSFDGFVELDESFSLKTSKSVNESSQIKSFDYNDDHSDDSIVSHQ